MAKSISLILIMLLLTIDTSSADCVLRRRWLRTKLCPPTAAEPSAAAVLRLPSEPQCVFACTLRLPNCKAAHFRDSVCSLAVNFTQLSLWSASAPLDQCGSLMVAPQILQLLAFFDFRESLEKAVGSTNISSLALNLTRDSDGLHFAGRMTSYLKLSIPGGLTALTDRNGERAVSFFMKVRRSYKSKTVYVKITDESSSSSVCDLYDNGGTLIFSYKHLSKLFTSTTNFMETDADTVGFFLGVSASNVTGAFAFLDGRVYNLTAILLSGQTIDSVILLGYSQVSDASCLAGTVVCFGITQGRMTADQLQRMSAMCV